MTKEKVNPSYFISKEFVDYLEQRKIDRESQTSPLAECVNKPKQRLIFKYSLGVPCYAPSNFIVTTPGARIYKILDIQMQGDTAVLWAEVELTDEDHSYYGCSVWTGDAVPEDKDFTYIATIQEEKTGLVYHYYIVLDN